MTTPLNLFEYEAQALARLPAGPRDYYAGGAGDELTLAANRAAWERLPLHYRVLRDVALRDTGVELFGQRLRSPVLVAPTAFHRLACDDGELATVRAAGAAGTAMVLSTLATTPMEPVCAAATGPVWFQLYVYRDRAVTRDLVQRAEAAGCQAIVLTVDAPVGAVRERDIRSGFQLPPQLQLGNLLPAGSRFAAAEATAGSFSRYVDRLFDPALSWSDLDWLCAATRLPVLVKGVVRADDAVRAVAHGARGVIVSNHGGRQLDTAPATAEVLPRIAAAVAGRTTLLVDGGIRRGTDVVKALALGAAAVLVGRPILWGLAVDGEAGARRVLELLTSEFSVAMALCGARSVAEIDRGLLDGHDRGGPT